MASLDETLDAMARLRGLMWLVLRSVNGGTAGSAGGAVELALQASASQPLVAAALHRRRNVDWSC